MSYASEWLVELDAHTGSEVVTLRYSVNGYTTGPTDDPANTTYDARISGIGSFRRNLFGEGRTTGQASVYPASLKLSNADGELDPIKRYAFDGRRFVIRRLKSPADAFSSAEMVLSGTLEGIDATAGSLVLNVSFYDRRRDIDVPIQEERYAGTTITAGPTAEGSPDMKERIKPLLLGKCFSVPATIVNDFNILLQFSSAAVHAIELFDGGVPLINDGDVPTIEALASATGNPGHYRTCLAKGLAKPFGTFRGRPAFIWTANVVEGATAADRTAAQIVRRMLNRIGLSVGNGDIDAASITALDAVADQELGIYIDNEASVLVAASQILQSVGGFITPDHLGRFVLGRLDLPAAPVATIIEHEVLVSSADDTLSFTPNPDTDGEIPAYKARLKYRRHYHVHSENDLGGCVNHTDETRASALKQEWREVAQEDAAVLDRHLLSQEIVFETQITDAADAQAEVDRKFDLYRVGREVTRVAVDLDDAALMIPNATVTLVADRFDYTQGKDMLIIGREDDFADEKAVLTLWG